MSQVDELPLLPLPVGGVSHAAVFFESLPKSLMTELLSRMRQDYPDLAELDPSRWGAVAEPRPINFGEISVKGSGEQPGSRWHLLIDSQGVAPEVQQAICSGPQSFDERIATKMEEAGACVLLFLLEDGESPSTGVSKMRTLCRPIWRLLEMGALGVAFPEGGTMLSAETLRLLSPEDLTAGHSYLMVGSGLAEKVDGVLWFRTYGMAQFGLPDLCLRVEPSAEDDLEDALLKARLLLETLPAEMIAQGGVLPQGGTVLVGERVFEATPPPEKLPPSLRSRFGFSHLR